jgi:hypothetical protein
MVPACAALLEWNLPAHPQLLPVVRKDLVFTRLLCSYMHLNESMLLSFVLWACAAASGSHRFCYLTFALRLP